MTKSEYECEKQKIYDEDNKKIKKLQEKYTHGSGILDGGIPKKERLKVTNDTLEKLKQLDEKYKKC